MAEGSLHRAIQSGELDHLDFARVATQEFGIDAIEYVNAFFFDKACDGKYLTELKCRADDHGVRTLLIMVDNEGSLGDPDQAKRRDSVENHFKWVEAAKCLGGHSIRVNADSCGTFGEQQKLAADGLRRLSEFAQKCDINVIVENHGGLSSNGRWLAGVIELVGLPNCGTLPDFGNFNISEDNSYDRYQGVEELMPFAKAVSAKSYDFDADGYETTIDYLNVMRIVHSAGYRGYVGIEYEGDTLREYEGVQATKSLLESVRERLSHTD